MKTLIVTTLASLTAVPALAHPGAHMHPHGQEPSLLLLMGLGFVLTAAAIAVKRALSK